MTIVGSNPRAGGSECIIFGHIGYRSHVFAPIAGDMRDGERKGEELASFGGWEVLPMRPSAGHETAPALVGRGAEGRNCRTTGRLLLVSHRWSGVLTIDNIGRRYIVDLFSEETRLVLLDIVNEIMVDVTALASTQDGSLAMPAMTVETLVRHIVDHGAWFRFLERDPDFEPSLARQAIEAFRPRPDQALKLRLLSSLVPVLASRPAPATAPHVASPPPADESRLRDEMRLLAAAVEGLAARAPARA